MQAENGSLIYFMPGMHPAYNPYSPYLPVTMIGVDGQYVGQQPCSPSPMFQPSMASPGYIQSPLPYGELVPSPYLWDSSVFVGDGAYGNGYSGILEIPGSISNISSPSHARAPPPKNLLSSDLNKSVEIKRSLPALDVTSGPSVRNQLKPVGKVF